MLLRFRALLARIPHGLSVKFNGGQWHSKVDTDGVDAARSSVTDRRRGEEPGLLAEPGFLEHTLSDLGFSDLTLSRQVTSAAQGVEAPLAPDPRTAVTEERGVRFTGFAKARMRVAGTCPCNDTGALRGAPG